MQVYVLQSQCMQHVASILDRNKYIVYIHEFIHLYNHLNLNQTGSLFDGILLLFNFPNLRVINSGTSFYKASLKGMGPRPLPESRFSHKFTCKARLHSNLLCPSSRHSPSSKDAWSRVHRHHTLMICTEWQTQKKDMIQTHRVQCEMWVVLFSTLKFES